MRPIAAGILATALTSLAAPAGAVVVGQLDTFADGTTGGWFAGGGPLGGTPPVPPAVVGSGGPGGAGDAYLQLSSTGSMGPGGGSSA